MPTSSVGKRSRRAGFSPREASTSRPASGPKAPRELKPALRGVTLIELLIVMAIVALLAGLSYPSAAAGLDSMRLRSVASEVASFLSTAMDRAERKQQVVELRISPAEDAIGARSGDSSFASTLTIPNSVAIASIEPPLANANGQNEARRFLIYPGGTLPRIAIDLVSKEGRKRRVVVDPITGLPHSETVEK